MRHATHPAAESAILATLERYGFEWDGEVVRQSRAARRTQPRSRGSARRDRRTSAHARAGSSGPRRSPPSGEHVYPGTCRDGIPADRAARAQRACRLRVGDARITFRDRLQGVQSQDLARDVGDFVIRRADGLYAYQLAVVVDDALQDVTHVVRGADLLASTPRQILLQRLLGYPELSYLHAPVAINAHGQKLSKQTRAAPPSRRRAAGASRGVAFPRSAASRRIADAGVRRRILAVGDSRVELRSASAVRDASRTDARRRRRLPERYNYEFPAPHTSPVAPRIPKKKPMTTLVAVRKNDEIAIAADSLTTFGDTRLTAQYDRSSEKIVHYKGTYIGLCGSAAHQLVFQSLLAKHSDLDFSNKAAIFETFRKLHPILKEQHFLNPKEEEDDPYESTQVTALVANEHGIFGVYSMREVFEYSQYWAVGSGREFALGAMYAQYPKLRTAVAIARAGVEAGATFDRNSGLPMTLYTVTAKRKGAGDTQGGRRMSLYIPGHFAPRDRSSVARLLHEHPFATLVTPSAAEPFVTHLPLIHVADCEPHGTLHGHFARTNPHVEAAAHGASLALFHGPHAYVTPSWYADPAGAVPTWNYAVAHAHGTIELARDPAETRAVLDLLIQRFEGFPRRALESGSHRGRASTPWCARSSASGSR